MAKNFGKFLLGMAAIGGVAAATYYYLQKKDAETVIPETEDEDYDDFSDELDEAPNRNYVQLTPFAEEIAEAKAEFAEAAEEIFEAKEDVAEIIEEAAEAVEEVVEEFFDEETPVTE